MKITLTKDGSKTAKHGKVKFIFHDFYLTVGDCPNPLMERCITLVEAYELGSLSAWCITGVKGRYKQSIKVMIKNMAKELARCEETSASREFEEKIF